tara:strand:- start:137 stop:406 length:270 start_codon:yes stop_codon:yes gene_type:complete
MNNNTQFADDETFEYIPSVGSITLEPITVSWNIVNDDIDITQIEFDNKVWTSEELWELDNDLAETIMEYIDDEFVSNNDFWFDKSNPEL